LICFYFDNSIAKGFSFFCQSVNTNSSLSIGQCISACHDVCLHFSSFLFYLSFFMCYSIYTSYLFSNLFFSLLTSLYVTFFPFCLALSLSIYLFLVPSFPLLPFLPISISCYVSKLSFYISFSSLSFWFFFATRLNPKFSTCCWAASQSSLFVVTSVSAYLLLPSVTLLVNLLCCCSSRRDKLIF